MIHSLSELNLSQRYTYADYLAWQFSERVELLKGYIKKMAAPNPRHQIISRKLVFPLLAYFEGKECQVFYAPFDVRLYNRRKSILRDQEVYTVVQPDLCLICDPSKLDERGCNGAPDWIIEIISPSTAQTDTKDKLALYEEAAVSEYWVVFPNEQLIQQFVLKDQKYELLRVFTAADNATPALFPELSIPLSEVFK